jgi:hypothetical protein
MFSHTCAVEGKAVVVMERLMVRNAPADGGGVGGSDNPGSVQAGPDCLVIRG